MTTQMAGWLTDACDPPASLLLTADRNALAMRERSSAAAAPITTANARAFPRTRLTTARQTPLVGVAFTLQIWFSVDSSSENTALAPAMRVTRPTSAPMPRAVSCVCMSLSVWSKMALNCGVDAEATASSSRARVSGP